MYLHSNHIFALVQMRYVKVIFIPFGLKAPWLGTGCIAHFLNVSPSIIPLLNDSSVEPSMRVNKGIPENVSALQPVSSWGAFDLGQISIDIHDITTHF